MFAKAGEFGLEGVMSKRAGSVNRSELCLTHGQHQYR